MKKTYLILLLSGFLLSCSKDKQPDPDPLAPGEVKLVKPAQNEVCVTGIVVSVSESVVNFQWLPSSNTKDYTVTVKNLATGQTSNFSTVNSNLDIRLLHNTPYSWNVSSNNGSLTATSASWKLYNSGAGIKNYAPYPADAMIPELGTTVNAVGNTVTLGWTGEDPDKDIEGYDVYFGESNTPALYQGGLKQPQLSVTTKNNSTYFWKVITKDSQGNTSSSTLYHFKTN